MPGGTTVKAVALCPQFLTPSQPMKGGSHRLKSKADEMLTWVSNDGSARDQANDGRSRPKADVERCQLG